MDGHDKFYYDIGFREYTINKGLLLFCLSITDTHLKSAMIVYDCKPTAQVVHSYHQLLSIDVNQFYLTTCS